MDNNKVTIGLLHLFEMFPDQDTAREYMEKRRWPDGVFCPRCNERKRIKDRKGAYYRCNACVLDFTVRTGTIFERSHVTLNKWLYAMYILGSSQRISSMQLSKEIGVTQKTAWFIMQRLRAAPTGICESWAADIVARYRSTQPKKS